MNKSIFYTFKIENIRFETTDHLTISTPFVKKDAVGNCQKELAKIRYKMAADQSHKIIRVNDELYIEGMAYQGEDTDHKMIQGYFNSLK